jgi:hypothetical protein
MHPLLQTLDRFIMLLRHFGFDLLHPLVCGGGRGVREG